MSKFKTKEERALEARVFQKMIFTHFNSVVMESIDCTTVYSNPIDVDFKWDKVVNIQVENTGSVEAVLSRTVGHTAVLNFASFKTPGGGYMVGSLAQEEVLCASSTLYPILSSLNSFYFKNRQNLNKGFYSDRAVFVPGVKFFGAEQSEVSASVISCAAPNLSYALKSGDKFLLGENSKALKQRIEYVLKIALEQGVETLVLGAFGCGVFKQDAREVAQIFKDTLVRNGKMLGFKEVIFAVPCIAGNRVSYYNHNAFKDILTHQN